MANSPKKHHSCFELLKRAGCSKIFFKYLPHIPTQFIFYFEPTPELETYLAAIEPQKLLLKESYYTYMKETLKAAISGEEFDQVFTKYKEKERVGIKKAFRFELEKEKDKGKSCIIKWLNGHCQIVELHLHQHLTTAHGFPSPVSLLPSYSTFQSV